MCKLHFKYSRNESSVSFMQNKYSVLIILKDMKTVSLRNIKKIA